MGVRIIGCTEQVAALTGILHSVAVHNGAAGVIHQERSLQTSDPDIRPRHHTTIRAPGTSDMHLSLADAGAGGVIWQNP